VDRLRLSLLWGVVGAVIAAAAAQPGSADRVRLVRADAASRRLPQSCLRLTPLRHGRVEAVIRWGRLVRSVTARAVGSAHVYGCDGTAARAEGRRWCDLANVAVRRGRSRDPRLGLLCRTRRGRRIATAWISPRANARTLVVADGGRRDTYTVIGGLPVRIATTHGIAYARASAVFAVLEYDAARRLIARFRLSAHVSG
jgi:hypothetical protein